MAAQNNFDPKKFAARVEYLKGLEKDWDGADAEPIDLKVIPLAEKMMKDLSSSFKELTAPGVFPIEPNGVGIEWITDKSLLSIDFSPVKPFFTVFYKTLNIEGQLWDYASYGETLAKVRDMLPLITADDRIEWGN